MHHSSVKMPPVSKHFGALRRRKRRENVVAYKILASAPGAEINSDQNCLPIGENVHIEALVELLALRLANTAAAARCCFSE